MKRKPKIDKSTYPTDLPKRYEIRQGKWGAYFYDKERSADMDLNAVLFKLELKNLRTKQLRWYVETFGEVKAPQDRGRGDE